MGGPSRSTSLATVLVVLILAGAQVGIRRGPIAGAVGPTILYVAANDKPPVPDRVIRDALTAAGYEVTIIDDDAVTTASSDGYDLVAISSSVTPATVGATFRDVSVPLVSWESYLHDDHGFVLYL